MYTDHRFNCQITHPAKHTPAHTRAHTHAHTRTHIHTHTHTHTQTHTHTDAHIIQTESSILQEMTHRCDKHKTFRAVTHNPFQSPSEI